MNNTTCKRLLHICILAVLYGAIYLICRHVFDVSGSYPVYTFGWSARHFIGLAAAISLIPACFGRIRFSYLTLAGYVIGNLAGELLGGFRSDIPPQYLHYGWLILIVTFLLSCIVGIFAERRAQRPRK